MAKLMLAALSVAAVLAGLTWWSVRTASHAQTPPFQANLVLPTLQPRPPADPKLRCNISRSPHARFLSSAGSLFLEVACGHRRLPRPPVRPEGTALGTPGEVAGYPATDVLVNNRATDLYSLITQNETTIAAKDSDVVIAWNDSGHANISQCAFTGFGRSTNGGLSFTDLGPFVNSGALAGNFGDPVLHAGDESAEFFAATLGANTGSFCGVSGRSFIAVYRSTDGGLTFPFVGDASPGSSAADFQDKEWITVDDSTASPFQGRVYACWTEFSTTAGVRVMFSGSSDNGATFAAPGPTVLDANGGTFCQLDTAMDGSVYVTWWAASSSSIALRRSDDGGGMWTAVATVSPPVTFPGTAATCGSETRQVLAGNIRTTAQPTIAVNPLNEHVYVAWESGVSPDIFFSRSEDGAGTWSAPTTVPVSSLHDQFFPSMAAAAPGTIKLIWYDRSHDAASAVPTINVRSADSTNGGLTWNQQVITDVPFSVPPINPQFDAFIADCYMGDYIAVTAGGVPEQFHIAWGDNRLMADATTYPGCGSLCPHPDPDVRYDRRGVAVPGVGGIAAPPEVVSGGMETSGSRSWDMLALPLVVAGLVAAALLVVAAWLARRHWLRS